MQTVDATYPVPAASASDERTLRVLLAGTYRVFAMLGWTELIYNHITVRVPGPKRHFLINPFGLHYSEVTASNLVKIDLDGQVVGETTARVNPRLRRACSDSSRGAGRPLRDAHAHHGRPCRCLF